MQAAPQQPPCTSRYKLLAPLRAALEESRGAWPASLPDSLARTATRSRRRFPRATWKATRLQMTGTACCLARQAGRRWPPTFYDSLSWCRRRRRSLMQGLTHGPTLFKWTPPGFCGCCVASCELVGSVHSTKVTKVQVAAQTAPSLQMSCWSRTLQLVTGGNGRGERRCVPAMPDSRASLSCGLEVLASRISRSLQTWKVRK